MPAARTRAAQTPVNRELSAQRLAELAETLVEALKRDDGEAAADALARLTEWDDRPLRMRLQRLAHALHQRVEALPTAPTATLHNGDEAAQSLDHVTRLTEQAAHRTLDLVEQGRALVGCLESSPDHVPACSELRSIFNELALAQGYQDITGQILKRVRSLLHGVEQSLHLLASGDDPLRGEGPAVPGADDARSSQGDADDLLAELGL